eukprot:UC4_evm4s1462
MRIKALHFIGAATASASAAIVAFNPSFILSPLNTSYTRRPEDVLYIWGSNAQGTVLGLPFTPPANHFKDLGSSVKTPHSVKIFGDPASSGIKDVAFGSAHAACIDGHGRLHLWGRAIDGSTICLNKDLGENAKEECSSSQAPHSFVSWPVTISINSNAVAQQEKKKPLSADKSWFWPSCDVRDEFKYVAASHRHVFVVTEHGRLFGCQVSHKKGDNYFTPLPLKFKEILPENCDSPGAKKSSIRRVFAGKHHIIALTNDGAVFSGATDRQKSNRWGQLGQGHFDQVESCTDTGVLSAIKNTRGVRICNVACGDHHTLLQFCEGGEIFAFGSNLSGQLGIKNPSSRHSKSFCRYTPAFVNGFWEHGLQPNDLVITKIAAGGRRSFFTVESTPDASQASSAVFGAGAGGDGSLGTPHMVMNTNEPIKIPSLSDHVYYDEQDLKTKAIRVFHIVAGRGHTYSVLDTRYSPVGGLDVYAWGSNRYGQCGNRKRSLAPTPEICIDPSSKTKLAEQKGDIPAVICAGVDNSALFRPVNPKDHIPFSYSSDGQEH